MELINCLETSVTNYHSTLRKIPEVRKYHYTAAESRICGFALRPLKRFQHFQLVYITHCCHNHVFWFIISTLHGTLPTAWSM
jgi:hypothetical protein